MNNKHINKYVDANYSLTLYVNPVSTMYVIVLAVVVVILLVFCRLLLAMESCSWEYAVTISKVAAGLRDCFALKGSQGYIFLPT